MPIKIPERLPAIDTLIKENIFFMDEKRAVSQDIRPLKIGILNLMPNKSATETQILRLLSNTPLQIEITLLTTASYRSKHTTEEYLKEFYKTFDAIRNEKFDGFIITGAPIEAMEYNDVSYWGELCEIIEWTKTHVFSTAYICWGALAGLYLNHNIEKHVEDNKTSGVFLHKTLYPEHPLVRGFDEYFYAPHSHYAFAEQADIEKDGTLLLLASSDEAGIYLVASKNGREIYVIGHSEYDSDTLKKEYFRDIERGLEQDMPKHYFPDNNIEKEPINRWRAHAHLLFSNWLNYFVYQTTPYNLNEIV